MNDFFIYFSTADDNQGHSIIYNSLEIGSKNLRGAPLSSGTYFLEEGNLKRIETPKK